MNEPSALQGFFEKLHTFRTERVRLRVDVMEAIVKGLRNALAWTCRCELENKCIDLHQT